MTIDVCDIYIYLGWDRHSPPEELYARDLPPPGQQTTSDVSFNGTGYIEIQTFKIGCQNDSGLCTGVLASQSDDIKHAQCRSSADDSCCTRHQLAEQYHDWGSVRKVWSSAIQSNCPKKKTSLDRPLVASTESIYHTIRVNAAKPYRRISLRRGQGWTWTLLKDLLNDLNAIDCNIDDVINFSSTQFTHLDDSFNSNFSC